MSNSQERIRQMVEKHPVLLFMKGSRRMPQCGFSATVVGILDQYVDDYETVNVLMDQEIREGVKAFANWPTIPQLYVKGEFVGGCDIVKDLDGSGELARLLGAPASAEVKEPKVQFSERAAAALREAMKTEAAPGQALRIEIDPSWQYGMFFDAPSAKDLRLEVAGIQVIMDRPTAKKADGLSIDFTSGPTGEGFKIENPNEPPKVQALAAEALKEMLDAKESLALIDVRTDEEIAAAKIVGSRKLDAAYAAELKALPKDHKLVFYCRSGQRSRAAAEEFLGAGFTKIWNLSGGIQAWAERVDPTLTPR